MKNLLIVFLFFSTSLFAHYYDVIDIKPNDTLNVRVAPSSSSTKVGELFYDTKEIELIKCKKTTASSSWCKIKFEDENSVLEGWVSKRYITPSAIVNLDIINKKLTTFKIKRMKNIYDKKRFPVEGEIAVAFTFNDKLGTNYIIYTEKEVENNIDSQTKDISIYHFKKSKNKITLLSRVHDFIECSTNDAFGLFILKNSLSITDLNKDGIAEVTFLYSYNCFCDGGPMNLKLMMLTNGKKYVIRGLVLTTGLETTPDALKMILSLDINKELKEAPKPFVEFMKKRWKAYKVWDLK